ncbi:MAG: S8 family serine peptidase, partial [Jaaginema sp. PMC 1079.18]|nr:S8 family serine peptidase [Jaaginema sp. PMC 1080.18]MEC4849957.1 S8 family serine peptidase [Jaaginema sp. PMC 1079.18]MEC4866141.1 S8 family serine peptidase [Jaaginema sp. PMC 1078.18]
MAIPFWRRSSQRSVRPQGQTFILESILTPSGIFDAPGDDTPDIDLDNDLSDLGDHLTLDRCPDDFDSWDGDLNPVPFFTEDNCTPQFDSGVFTVDDSGQVSIDFLYDGGGYKGQLAIFSLTDMEHLEPGSEDFIEEAARRALSNSTEGYIVIDDATEGARFSGSTPWEGNFNSGDHIDPNLKTFEMKAGDKFGVMLVPNGTVEQVANNPNIGGSVRPLFSLATANPEDAFHVGQIADVTGDGNTFVMEDLRVDGWTDKDYNDIVFQVRGATGEAVDIDDVINSDRNWTTTEEGQALIDYAKAYVEPISETGITVDAPVSDQPLIGVIDTGFSGNNPDLDYSNITLGRDWVNGDENPLLESGETDNHGTHILGLIAAQQDNDMGIDGINDDAPLWVGRAVGSGEWADSLKEFVDAAKDSNQPNAVVNLSFDLTQIDAEGNVTTRYEFTPAEREALEYARQNGVLIVAASGNDGDVMSALGQASQEFDNIITVGAANGVERAEYSSYGAGLDIMAQGGNADQGVVSLAGDDLGVMAGTSVATAKVTGAASQVWAANPDLSYRQVIEILKGTATDIDAPGWDAETGAGLLNLAAAISVAKVTQSEQYNPEPLLIPTTWGGEGTVTPRERAVRVAKLSRTTRNLWLTAKSILAQNRTSFYQVKLGDTPSSIAQKLNVPQNSLPSRTYTGQWLRVPQPTPINTNPTPQQAISQVYQAQKAQLGQAISGITNLGNGFLKQTFTNGYVIWNGQKAVANYVGTGQPQTAAPNPTPQPVTRPFPDGTLVQGSGVKIYLMENGVRRHIPDAYTFYTLGYDF